MGALASRLAFYPPPEQTYLEEEVRAVGWVLFLVLAGVAVAVVLTAGVVGVVARV